MTEGTGTTVGTGLSGSLRPRSVGLNGVSSVQSLDETAIPADSIDAMFHEVADWSRFPDVGMGEQP